MSNKSKIQALEKKIDQLANRISLQKNKERFLAQKRKTTLGKIFIMAGARKFFNGESKPFNFVIGLGGLFYIVEMQDRKLSVLLGACHLMFEKFGNDDEMVKYVSMIGDNFYADYLSEKRLRKEDNKQKEEKLEYPLNFFLGVIVEAKNFLTSDEKITQCHEIGDRMFNDLKNKKIENYKKTNSRNSNVTIKD